MAEHTHGPEQGQGSSTPPLPDVAMIGVGEALRQRREQLGWSLDDVSGWLRIRRSYLEALESGQAGILPAEVYALGFLRTYGQALGFDPESLAGFYRKGGRAAGHRPELDFPVPIPDRRLPPAVAISIGLGVVVLSYVGWYCFMGRATPLPEPVPPVASLMPGEAARNAPSPQVASILPEKSGIPDTASGQGRGQDVPVPPPLPQSPEAVQDSSESAFSGEGAAPQAAGAPEHSAEQGASVPVSGAEVAQSAAAPAGGSVVSGPSAGGQPMVIRAGQVSWIQVRDGAGKVVYDKVLQPGESWNVPEGNGPYDLTVGNAGGITVNVGDVTTPPLGRNGAVRRHLVLSAQAVRDGSLVASVAAPPVARSAPADVAPSVPHAASDTDKLNADQIEGQGLR
ncbi:MAG: RodZ domain-containing protein [Acetobacter papayae]|uniref:helix-turn-helix domain-containing protein n=1 Tax=Acetobacter papayae TaxID=1076592 RepID=UPI0039ECD9B6